VKNNHITSKDILRETTRKFNNYEYRLYNTFIYGWESDFFAISSSGYSIEVEVKISKNDFNNDFNKTHLRNRKNKHELMINNSFLHKPNKFYFAFPKGMVEHSDIDVRYGIIEADDKYNCRIVRHAKFLHKQKLLKNPIYLKILMDRFYYRYISLRRHYDVEQLDIEQGQKRIQHRFIHI